MFVFICKLSVFAQFEDFEDNKEKPKISIKDKVFFGGDFGLQIGTETNVILSPQVGYLINQYWAVGTGANFMYRRIKYQYTVASELCYGGNVFTQIYPLPFLVLHGETQVLNIKDNYGRAIDIPILAGGGYRQKYGKKMAANYMILWNFNQTQNSVYPKLSYRISFYF